MLRAILAVIAGYVALFLWAFASMTVAWLVLGQSFAFEEGTTNTTTGWSVVALALGFAGAILAGLVAAAIARTRTPVKVLAGLVLVLGLAEAVAVALWPHGESTDATEAVPADMNVLEAASEAMPQPWYGFTVPFVGVAGVLIGGALKKGGTSSASAPPAPDAAPGV